MTTTGSPSSSASRAVSEASQSSSGRRWWASSSTNPDVAADSPVPNSDAYRSASARAPSRSPARSRRASSPSRQPDSATTPSWFASSSSWVNPGTAFVPARFARDTSRHSDRQPAASRASRRRCGPRCGSPTPRWSSLTTRRWPGSRARSGRGRCGRPSVTSGGSSRTGGRRPGRHGRLARHDEAAGIRDAGVEQLDLEPQDRVQPGGLGGGREPDRAVQALVVGDPERRHPELDRPRDEVVGRRGAVQEREVAVAMELGVSGHETVSGGRAQIVEQMFGLCQ